jgi:hypothetical protein
VGCILLGADGVRVCPGTTTLAATMAGPLFYPANAAGPELLTALREACEGGPSGAGRAGPMRRLVLELQEGIRDALPKEADPHQEQASMQVSSTPGLRGEDAGSGQPARGAPFHPSCCLGQCCPPEVGLHLKSGSGWRGGRAPYMLRRGGR